MSPSSEQSAFATDEGLTLRRNVSFSKLGTVVNLPLSQATQAQDMNKLFNSDIVT